MQRTIGLVIATFAFSSLSGGPVSSIDRSSYTVWEGAQGFNFNWSSDQGTQRGVPIDVAALLTQARGAPPMICSLASNAIRRWGWGDWDAPATPLAAAGTTIGDRFSDEFTGAQLQQLLGGLGSDDACVRELSVRLIGTQKPELVGADLVTRLGAPDAGLRAIAALGLGLVEAKTAVDPLIRTLRDQNVDVRANAAWALGRLEDGRSLAPLVALFNDGAEKVRLAAIGSVGHMDDSASSIPALIRVLRQDTSPAVRRVAAWALGNLEARDGVQALVDALGRDTDARVREMSAWALGNIEDRRGVEALGAAARNDAEDRVRETAVWALGNIEDRSTIDLLAAATADKSPNVRGTAAWAIGNVAEEGARAPAGLLRLLNDESTETRLKAAWALGQLEDPGAIGPVREALKNEKNERVRRALIRALMKSGESSQETLTQLLSSSDPKVREAAVRGIAGARSFDPWPWPQPRPRPFP